jgi:ABC-type transport system involved in multi-copper enzyme maturation permease subunit
MTDPEGVPRIHPLENPFVWFLLQASEYVVATLLLSLLLPNHLPLGVGLAIFVTLIVGITSLNYAIRRRFIPR